MKSSPTVGYISPLTTCNSQKRSVATQTERYTNTYNDEYDDENDRKATEALEFQGKIIKVITVTVYAVPTFVAGLAIGAVINNFLIQLSFYGK